MKKIFTCIFFCLVSISGIVHAQKADIIIINGKITTLDDNNPEVQAVAIAGNKVILTGANAQALKLK